VFGAVAGRFGTPKHQHVLDNFAREAGRIPLNMNNVQKCLKDLSSAGLSENEVAESISMVTAFAGISRIVDATGHKSVTGSERGISIIVPMLSFIRKYFLVVLALLLYFFWK